jgi:hypothetical protein
LGWNWGWELVHIKWRDRVDVVLGKGGLGEKVFVLDNLGRERRGREE